jgi:hypothetical protein
VQIFRFYRDEHPSLYNRSVCDKGLLWHRHLVLLHDLLAKDHREELVVGDVLHDGDVDVTNLLKAVS